MNIKNDYFNGNLDNLAKFLSRSDIRPYIKEKNMDDLYSQCPKDLRAVLTDFLYEKVNFDPIPYFTLELPEGFAFDRGWKDLQLPPTCQYLDGVFYGCDINNLFIPKNIQAMTGECFGTGTISRVYFDGGVDEWCSINFGDRDSNPIWCADLYFNNKIVKELVIPGHITHIKDYQFYGCNTIQSVHIGEGVKTIGQQCFENCENIKEIYFPSTLTDIYHYAFGQLSNLESIIYSGTVQEWNQITLHDSCFEEVPPNVIVHCRDKDTQLYV